MYATMGFTTKMAVYNIVWRCLELPPLPCLEEPPCAKKFASSLRVRRGDVEMKGDHSLGGTKKH